MPNKLHSAPGRGRPGSRRLPLSKRLTPQERQALWLVAGLFLLGLLVRWYRFALAP